MSASTSNGCGDPGRRSGPTYAGRYYPAPAAAPVITVSGGQTAYGLSDDACASFGTIYVRLLSGSARAGFVTLDYGAGSPPGGMVFAAGWAALDAPVVTAHTIRVAYSANTTAPQDINLPVRYLLPPGT